MFCERTTSLHYYIIVESISRYLVKCHICFLPFSTSIYEVLFRRLQIIERYIVGVVKKNDY